MTILLGLVVTQHPTLNASMSVFLLGVDTLLFILQIPQHWSKTPIQLRAPGNLDANDASLSEISRIKPSVRDSDHGVDIFKFEEYLLADD